MKPQVFSWGFLFKIMYSLPKIEAFNQNVLSKYQIYNSLFLTLPFDEIDNTGVMLPLFSEVCDKGFKKQETPIQIVDFFASKYLDKASELDRIDLMFRFIQYIERQIVLFDAIEDASFSLVNNLGGRGSLRDIKEIADEKEKTNELRDFLENFNVRPVLTAHPTQFYPGTVLGIITDLTTAIREDDLLKIKQLLSQLGKTPFIKSEKPTPFDEAVSLIWYLENVFYETVGSMMLYLQKNIFQDQEISNPIFNLGFWPGGDRDGNPYVTTEISLNVADRLRTSILKCYYSDIRKLKRKLTFSNIDTLISEIEVKIYRSVFYSQGDIFISLNEFKDKLHQIKDIVIEQHQSLYLEDINSLINKVNHFGFHFATLDIRQNSKLHSHVYKTIIENSKTPILKNYNLISDSEKLKLLSEVNNNLNPKDYEDEMTNATLDSVLTMKSIQEKNGEFGCNRYIISNCESAIQVMETYALFGLCGWKNPTVDIIPLFEVIDDLQHAPLIMEQLYTNEAYKNHLANRGNKQTVMLGFSDGTKDGGYLMANWSIYKAKENITTISRKYGIKVVFFDGRGGPPARGGGKTHKFYASLGSNIENEQIQITVQGQTISSNFGTLDTISDHGMFVEPPYLPELDLSAIAILPSGSTRITTA